MEGIWGIPISTILHGHSNSCHHKIIYLLQVDGDARLDCRVCLALELPLGVAPHLQGEDPMVEEGTNNPWRRQPRSFRSSIASGNKRKCYSYDRVGVLDHDSDMLGRSQS